MAVRHTAIQTSSSSSLFLYKAQLTKRNHDKCAFNNVFNKVICSWNYCSY